MNRFRESGLLDPRNFKLRFDAPAMLGAAACIAISSLAAFAAKPELGEVASALIFVLGITLAGAFFGLAAGLTAAVAAFLLYNFYLTEPVLTFRLATGSDIAPLVVFNLCAAVAGILAGRLKDRAQAASRSNVLLSNLLDASQALQSAIRFSDIGATLAGLTPGQLSTSLRLFAVKNGELLALDTDNASTEFREAALAALRQDPSDASDKSLRAYRLYGSEGAVGVIVREEAMPDSLDAAFLTALCNLVTLAIERATLSERISESRATARAEELKTALLSSVSHDFRTPLATISASASSLIDYREQLDRQTTGKLLRGIVDECERLNRYTANLLEMSRLEAGQSLVKRQAIGVSDMLSAVLQRVRPRAGNRKFCRAYGDSEIAVVADAALFELVLVNVLDNAILYSEDGSTIGIEASADVAGCRIMISDEGHGIPDRDLNRVFERFYRVPRSETSRRGSGLGLAIAKGFVEALGGSIEARTPGIGGRGTSIIIVLPLAEIDAGS